MLTLAGKPLAVPVLQGGMGVGVSLGGLAGAVAACGGMGCISTADTGYREPDFARDPYAANLRALKKEIAKAKEIANGAGLVAPQVGILRRVCLVLDEEAEEYLELINPEIIAQSGEQTGLEGCLSVPGKWGIVTRPNRVRVRAQDRDGDWFEAEAEGLTARAFCHEIEHLDGHLFVEHTDHLLTEEELEEYIRRAEAENGDEDE